MTHDVDAAREVPTLHDATAAVSDRARDGAIKPSSAGLTVRLRADDSTLASTVELACGSSCLTVEAVVTGGHAPYTFVWDDGLTRASRQLCLGAHRVEVRDSPTSDEFGLLQGTGSAAIELHQASCGADAGSDSGAADPDAAASTQLPDGCRELELSGTCFGKVGTKVELGSHPLQGGHAYGIRVTGSSTGFQFASVGLGTMECMTDEGPATAGGGGVGGGTFGFSTCKTPAADAAFMFIASTTFGSATFEHVYVCDRCDALAEAWPNLTP